MNDTAKNGIGCGVLFLLFVVGFALLPENTFVNIMAWGIALSIPLGIGRFIFRDLFEDFGWWIWGGAWLGAIVLGFLVPIGESGKSDTKDAPVAESGKGLDSGSVKVSADEKTPTVEAHLVLKSLFM